MAKVGDTILKPMNFVPKGRPPLAPRITELEKQVDTLLNLLKSLSDRITVLEKVPGVTKTYESRFAQWPSVR